MINPDAVAIDVQSSTSTSDTVAAALSRAIHEHRLAPSTKLGEDELAEVYGVSRTIIRTALQSLAHAKLVEIQRNRGAFVSQPTPKEAQEVLWQAEITTRSCATYGAKVLAHNLQIDDEMMIRLSSFCSIEK